MFAGQIEADLKTELEAAEDKAKVINNRLQVSSNTGFPCRVHTVFPYFVFFRH